MSKFWKDCKAVARNLLSIIFILMLVGGAIGGIVILRLSLRTHFEPEPLPQLSTLTLTLTPSTMTEGSDTNLSGTLSGTKENKTTGLASKTIDLHYDQPGATLTSIGSVTTGSDGNYNYLWSDSSSLTSGSYQLQASWNGGEGYPNASASAGLLIIPKVVDGNGNGDGYPAPYLVVDPSSYASLNYQNGTNIGTNFVLGKSYEWYLEKEEDFWYPGYEYVGSYGFGPDCCGYLPVWDVEDTIPGSLQEEPIHSAVEYQPHLGSHSYRIWLKYGPGNNKDEWWYYGVGFPNMAGIKGLVPVITDLDSKVVFEWWAFREKSNEKFIDASHVKAYLMEVVVDINDTQTMTVYRLHYIQDIVNQLGFGPEDTETDAYLYETGSMPGFKWEQYSHDITLDFQRSFGKVPSARYTVCDVHLWTRWYGVSCGASGDEYPTAGIDFDDLRFTTVQGVSSSPIHFVYVVAGCTEMEELSIDLSAQVAVDGKVIETVTATKSSTPPSDLWSDTWDTTVPLPEDAALTFGQEYNSITLTVTSEILATYDDGSTATASVTMSVTISKAGWYGFIVPTPATKVTVEET